MAIMFTYTNLCSNRQDLLALHHLIPKFPLQVLAVMALAKVEVVVGEVVVVVAQRELFVEALAYKYKVIY